jgi:uncharacterized protein (TIGR02246 family)
MAMALLRMRMVMPLVVTLVAAACRSGAPETDRADSSAATSVADAIAAVRAADSSLAQAVAARDVNRTVSFYAEDASMLPVAEPIVTGREAIRAEWTKIFAIPGFANASRTVHVDASGDLAYTRGTFQAQLTSPDGKPVTEVGKWVSVWRRQADGAWRVVVEIYNTDAPPPEHG